MNASKELIIKDDDRILEYQEKLETSKLASLQVYQEGKVRKKKVQETKVSLYKKFLQREEYRKPEAKETVLDEEEYLQCLEEIIQKNYYPELYRINKEKVK